jgi:hypothetical protein
MKISILKYLMLSSFSLIVIYMTACGDPPTFQSKGDYICGNVIFADTNFVEQGGTYAVALYPYETPGFTSKPLATEIVSEREMYPLYFRIKWGGKGYCYAAVVWIDTIRKADPIILGAYGCDTTHGCMNPKIIEFPNYTGTNYNILSWADTTRRIF